jgi:hypothetical protein
MIRRDDGNDWLLISQVEHARLAGEIAAAWGNDRVAPLPAHDLLMHAIAHHDDGWVEWERTPRIDPATGRPREFTEMPMGEATAIWSHSIEKCGQHSSWGGVWVSLHFCWLAEKARESRRGNSAETNAIDRFLAEQSRWHAEWRTEIKGGLDAAARQRRIVTGFHWVQFFDRVSLWLCCAARSDPWEVESPPTPDAMRFTFTPQSPTRIVIQPNPLRVGRLDLSVSAQRIPQREYANDQELHATLRNASHEALQWSI